MILIVDVVLQGHSDDFELCNSLPERTVSFDGVLWTNVERRVGELRNSSLWNTCGAPTPASAPSASATPAPTPGRPSKRVLEVTTALTQAYADLRKIQCQRPSEIWNINKISRVVCYLVHYQRFLKMSSIRKNVNGLRDTVKQTPASLGGGSNKGTCHMHSWGALGFAQLSQTCFY